MRKYYPHSQPMLSFTSTPDGSFKRRKCINCLCEFWARRRHAKTCGARCRQAYSRIAKCDIAGQIRTKGGDEPRQ